MLHNIHYTDSQDGKFRQVIFTEQPNQGLPQTTTSKTQAMQANMPQLGKRNHEQIDLADHSWVEQSSNSTTKKFSASKKMRTEPADDWASEKSPNMNRVLNKVGRKILELEEIKALLERVKNLKQDGDNFLHLFVKRLFKFKKESRNIFFYNYNQIKKLEGYDLLHEKNNQGLNYLELADQLLLKRMKMSFDKRHKKSEYLDRYFIEQFIFKVCFENTSQGNYVKGDSILHFLVRKIFKNEDAVYEIKYQNIKNFFEIIRETLMVPKKKEKLKDKLNKEQIKILENEIRELICHINSEGVDFCSLFEKLREEMQQARPSIELEYIKKIMGDLYTFAHLSIDSDSAEASNVSNSSDDESETEDETVWTKLPLTNPNFASDHESNWNVGESIQSVRVVQPPKKQPNIALPQSILPGIVSPFQQRLRELNQRVELQQLMNQQESNDFKELETLNHEVIALFETNNELKGQAKNLVENVKKLAAKVQQATKKDRAKVNNQFRNQAEALLRKTNELVQQTMRL